MNTLNSKHVILAAFVMFITAGCSTLSSVDESVDSLDQGANIEVVKSKALSIYKVRLRQEDGNTIISGKIRPSRVQRYISGHIDINIQNAAGKTLQNLSTEIHHKSIHRHHLTHSPRFRVVLSDSIPSNARIRVNYHSNKEGNAYSNECKNMHCSESSDSKIH